MKNEKEIRQRLDELIHPLKYMDNEPLRKLGHLIAIAEIKSCLGDEDQKEYDQQTSEILRDLQEGKAGLQLVLPTIRRARDEYIAETEHGVADEPESWQEAIKDFVLALEHWF